MRLKIEQTSFNPSTRKVWLEGVELRHLMDLTLEFSPDVVTTATLTIGVDALEVDAETAAHLIAEIREAAIRGESAKGAD